MSSDSSNTSSRTIRNRIIAVVIAVIVIVAAAIAVLAFRNGDSSQAQQQTTQQQSQQSEQHAEAQPNNQQSDVSPLPASLQQAVKACDPHNDFNSSDNTKESLIADGTGKSLTLLSGSQSDFTTFNCVAKQLDMPEADVTAMTAKQDQPNQQTFTWNGLTASWIYNANSGLSLTITAAK